MNILNLKLEDLEIGPETSEWLDEKGWLPLTIQELASKQPDPYNDEDDSVANQAGEDICRAIGYWIWRNCKSL